MSLLSELLLRHAEARPDEDALLVHRDRAFRPITWKELRDDVLLVAQAITAFGVAKGDRVAHVSENRYEWILTDLALLAIGAVHVPIHASLSGPQIAEQITHSGAMLVILAGKPQADKLSAHEGVRSTCRFAVYDPWPRCERHPLGPAAFCSLGDDSKATSSLSEVASDDLATIMYTSGTTGRPKGVMLTHGNLASNATATTKAYSPQHSELRLCFLPLSHIYARTCDLYAWLVRGSRLALARSRETILDDCRAVHPTVINGVPYFYEKVARGLRDAGRAETPGALRAALGGEMRMCFCGGAALPDHLIDFFASQDLPLLSGYGLTEASPASGTAATRSRPSPGAWGTTPLWIASTTVVFPWKPPPVITVTPPGEASPGAVGRPVPGIEVKIADDGEVLTRGPHVMQGYWQDPEATAEVLQDDWLHTGDVGEFDAEGRLHITGRKKEMIVLATGYNVAPTYVEGLLMQSPLIAQVIVLGNDRPYLTAIMVPEPERLRSEIKARRIRVFSKRGALKNKKVRAMYRSEIDRCLSGASEHDQIGDFRLIGRSFSIEHGEMTPKLSLCRDVIAQTFAGAIDEMYRRAPAGHGI